MGASAWHCVAPFEEDAEDVLSKAQQRAFARREYGKPGRRGQPIARTIRELRQACSEDGTASILDVRSLSDAPGPGVAGPFPAGTATRLFGTKRPALADVQEALSDERGQELYEQLGRGECGYLLAYEGERPSHVVFLGLSYD